MSSLFTTWLTDLRSQPSEDDATAGGVPAEAGVSAGAEAAAAEAGVTATAAEAAPAAAEASPADAEAAPAGATTAQKPARTAVLDAQLAAAIDVARSAIAEVAGSAVIGEHLGATAEGTRLVTHYFVCTDPSYRGWRWVAVLARAPRSKKVTVCETALLPGPDALVAPEWVPGSAARTRRPHAPGHPAEARQRPEPAAGIPADRGQLGGEHRPDRELRVRHRP